MMEDKPIKSRNRQRMWKQLKTTETEQEVVVWEGRRTAGGKVLGECLRSSAAWQDTAPRFSSCFESSLGEQCKDKHGGDMRPSW